MDHVYCRICEGETLTLHEKGLGLGMCVTCIKRLLRWNEW